MSFGSFNFDGNATSFIPQAQPFQASTELIGAAPILRSPEPSEFKFCWASDHTDQESHATFLHTKWDALLTVVQNISGGRDCAYFGERYHGGGRHIVRRIIFSDGSEDWLVRVPIMQTFLTSLSEEEDINWLWDEKDCFQMESEIATMYHVSSYTNIPVPRIYGYNSHMEDNPVGFPYLLMECMKGNVLAQGDVLMDENVWCKVRNIMAWIQCQLTTASVPEIGSLILKDDCTIGIGKLPLSFGCDLKGPFTATSDYLLSWANNMEFGKASTEGNIIYDDYITEVTHEFLPRLQTAIIDNKYAIDCPPYDGHYYIVHPDLHPCNVLFDDDWNLVGVIDWEFSYTAPLPIFASRILNKHYGDISLGEGMGSLYVEDIKLHERQMGIGTMLSEAFENNLGALADSMYHFELGMAFSLIDAMDRFEDGFISDV